MNASYKRPMTGSRISRLSRLLPPEHPVVHKTGERLPESRFAWVMGHNGGISVSSA